MICVTGGSGFFGIALVKKLLALGEHVRVIDLEFVDKEISSKVDFRRVDIQNAQETADALKGCDLVYHIAAVVPISRSGQKFWSINEKGTQNVLDGAIKGGAKRLIYFSTSSSIYGIPESLPVTEDTAMNPIGDYGKSKYAAELICKKYRDQGLNLSIVRPRTIVGRGRLGIFQILFEWISKDKTVYLIGKGNNKLQLIGLNDLVDVSIILRRKGDFEDFNIGAELFGTLRSDLEELIKKVGSKSNIVTFPGWLVRPSLRVLDVLRLSPFVDLHYKTIDKDFYFDISKAGNLLNWKPKESNVDCLYEAYEWYLNNADSVDNNFGTTHRKSVRKGLASFLR